MAKQAIKKFDNNAVDNLVCTAKPFLKKGEVHERIEPSLLDRRVYLMNLPYDATIREIESLCKEFAPIDKAVVPRDPNGLARGYAFVYLQSAKDVDKLIDFVDGRHIRSRQVRASKTLGENVKGKKQANE